MARMLLAVYGLLMVVTIALQGVFDGRLWALFAPSPAGPLEVDFALGLVLGLGVAAATQWAAQRVTALREMSEGLGEILRPLSHRDVFAQALFSALAEEMFFRGFLQPGVGLHLSSLVFGLVHVPRDRRLRLWQPLGVVLGYVLGWMFLERGTLLAPVVAHFTINYFNMHFVLSRRAVR